MGWMTEDAPGHEGYLGAVVREDDLSADGIVLSFAPARSTRESVTPPSSPSAAALPTVPVANGRARSPRLAGGVAGVAGLSDDRTGSDCYILAPRPE